MLTVRDRGHTLLLQLAIRTLPRMIFCAKMVVQCMVNTRPQGSLSLLILQLFVQMYYFSFIICCFIASTTTRTKRGANEGHMHATLSRSTEDFQSGVVVIDKGSVDYFSIRTSFLAGCRRYAFELFMSIKFILSRMPIQKQLVLVKRHDI